MHELPITQSLLDLVLEHAEEAGGGKVTNIYLVVGKLSSVVDRSVQFYWDIISEGTDAEGAELHFRHTPLEMECLDCGAVFEPEEFSYTCESCSGLRVRVKGGTEFLLEAMDLETAEVSDTEPGS